MPSVKSFDVELDLWQDMWTSEDAKDVELIDTPEKALPHADYDYYPNIYTLLVILATLPVTSCECERSISLLRLLKTPLCSTMTGERLNALALLQFHHDIPLSADEVVQEFAQRHPRRLLMIDPCSDD